MSGMVYTPEQWVIVKITGTDPHYRVFGSWRGGFASGDSWRMNSGIVGCQREEYLYRFDGHSGSAYICNKGNYGIDHMGMHNRGVLDAYISSSKGTMSLCDNVDDWTTIDWSMKNETDTKTN